MCKQPYVNLLGNWCKLESEDSIEGMPFGKWHMSKDLDALEGDFLKIKHRGKTYIIHKSNFVFVREK